MNVDAVELAAGTGWDQSAIETMELYRDSQTVIVFPTRSELHSVLSEYFEEVAISTGTSEIGRRCPIMVLRPRRRALGSHGVAS